MTRALTATAVTVTTYINTHPTRILWAVCAPVLVLLIAGTLASAHGLPL